MNSDIETLIRATTYDPLWTGMNDGAAGVAGRPTESMTSVDDSRESRPDEGLTQLVAEMKKLVDSATAAGANNIAPTKAASTGGASQESGFGEMAIRTAAMMTGVGPLVNGLLKLFGSNQPEPLPALEKFNVPSSVSVEAGLTRDREYSALRYVQGGTPEASSGSSGAPTQSPTIQVNIQAMDSQSFLDRQDDIARAVREAMLHSNSINDIVLEL
jgi:hypothetical protein